MFDVRIISKEFQITEKLFHTFEPIIDYYIWTGERDTYPEWLVDALEVGPAVRGGAAVFKNELRPEYKHMVIWGIFTNPYHCGIGDCIVYRSPGDLYTIVKGTPSYGRY